MKGKNIDKLKSRLSMLMTDEEKKDDGLLRVLRLRYSYGLNMDINFKNFIWLANGKIAIKSHKS